MLEGYTLDNLEKKIGYSFQNRKLLEQALTHSSYANERKINQVKDYERIEFLGDAVLELVSSEFLFHENPDMPEGTMTRTRASMVCEVALAYSARELELGNYLFLGKGEELTGGRNRDSIIADVMEAITGAIYLDSGFEQAKAFIMRFILSDLDRKKLFYDAKTIFQETIQKRGEEIHYVLTGEAGPEHAKCFFVDVYCGNRKVGSGSGPNKKSAEQQAAFEALKQMVDAGEICI